MGWADRYIDKLNNGEIVSFRPRGNSMTGKINSGQLVTVEPLKDYKIKKGDILLCKVGRAQYLHLVKAVDKPRNRYLIGNNKGHTNGWINQDQVFGICTQIGK